tara:strand:+ start:45566 stop:46675 length:1110 start_codon:yes stop_codon:yes gene_type:complete
MPNDNNEFPSFLESPEEVVSLGKALQDARVIATLSVDDVAKKLNLGVATIHDLENNLDQILETQKYPIIYLRGYLSNYAKLVELTGLELYPEYQLLHSAQKQKQTLKSPSLIMPRAKKRSKKLPFFLLLVSAAVAFGYSFQEQLFNTIGLNVKNSEPISGLTSESEFKQDLAKKLLIQSGLHSSQSESTDSSMDNSIENEIINPENSTESTFDSTPTETEDDDQTQNDENFPLNNDAINNSVEDVEPSTTVATGIVSSNLASIVSNKIVINDAVNQAFTDPEIETSNDGAPESLSLVFNGECWTEVFDATGERIAFGLYSKGQVLSLSGLAPFKLKLGDPSAVEIEYQDKIINGEFTPGRSAQFSVPLS